MMSSSALTHGVGTGASARRGNRVRLKRWLLHAAVLLTLALAAIAVPGSSTRAGTAAAAAGRPNIVFILTDDLDAETIAFAPHLRSLLVDGGTSFSNAFVNVALCCPSRASTLRGQYAHSTGVLTNRPPDGGFETFHDLGREGSTVATWLRAAGYRTALLGKYLNGYPNGVDPTYVPPGWDEWRSPVRGNPYSEYNYTLNENGQIVAYGNGPEEYLGDVLAVRATDFIRRSAADGQPFFLYLATYAPHGPATPAPRHLETFADATAPRTPAFDEQDVEDKPAWVRALPPLDDRATGQIDGLYRKRLQSMLAVDETIEGLVRTLEATGQPDNTYIVFSSDNGFHLGQHRQGPGKQAPYEEDIRVPLIVRGPGAAAGLVIDALVGNVDLAPTFAELAGAATPEWVEGRSLVPLLRGDAPSAEGWRQAFLLEHGSPNRDRDRADRRDARRQRGAESAADNDDSASSGVLEPDDDAAATVDDEPDQDDPAAPERRPRRERDRPRRARTRAAPPEFQAIRTADHLYVEYATGERELYDLRADPDQLESVHDTADPEFLAQLSARLDALRRCSGSACRAADASPFGVVVGRVKP